MRQDKLFGILFFIVFVYASVLSFFYFSNFKNVNMAVSRPDLMSAVIRVDSENQKEIRNKIAEFKRNEAKAISAIKENAVKRVLQPIVMADEK